MCARMDAFLPWIICWAAANRSDFCYLLHIFISISNCSVWLCHDDGVALAERLGQEFPTEPTHFFQGFIGGEGCEEGWYFYFKVFLGMCFAIG